MLILNRRFFLRVGFDGVEEKYRLKKYLRDVENFKYKLCYIRILGDIYEWFWVLWVWSLYNGGFLRKIK